MAGLLSLRSSAQDAPVPGSAPPRAQIDPSELDPRVRAAAAALDRAKNGQGITVDEWTQVCEACGLHPAVQSMAVRLDPFPGETFVGLLDHSTFAVRNGALEILEGQGGA